MDPSPNKEMEYWIKFVCYSMRNGHWCFNAITCLSTTPLLGIHCFSLLQFPGYPTWYQSCWFETQPVFYKLLWRLSLAYVPISSRISFGKLTSGFDLQIGFGFCKVIMSSKKEHGVLTMIMACGHKIWKHYYRVKCFGSKQNFEFQTLRMNMIS